MQPSFPALPACRCSLCLEKKKVAKQGNERDKAIGAEHGGGNEAQHQVTVVRLSGEALTSVQVEATTSVAEIVEQVCSALGNRVCTLLLDGCELRPADTVAESGLKAGDNAVTAIVWTPAQLKDMGYTARNFRNTGYTVSELRGAGYTVKDLRAGGYTSKDLRAGSCWLHLSIVICGHVDSGKSCMTGRLLWELGEISERNFDKLVHEAERCGQRGNKPFIYIMDQQKEERERGVTIACKAKEFFTEKRHYTIIDVPGHRDFIKNMITGASQADVALIMVPADGNFTTAIARGNHKAGEVQGQTRQHSRLISLLGIKQIIICVNKMDCDTAGYKQHRYDEIVNAMKNMLVAVGWKKDFIEKGTPFLPISAALGDNLIKKSENMGWWTGCDVIVGSGALAGENIHVDCLYDALDRMCQAPERPVSAPMRMPISGIYKIKGIGDVLVGRVEQGVVKPCEEVLFLPTHTASNPCGGRVFTIEMHHQRCELANPGDYVGLNIQGLDRNNMPHSRDTMIYKNDMTLGQTKEFDAHVQVLDIPNEIKVGYSPIGFVRCGRAACRISKLKWKIGKETGGKKIEKPCALKSNEMAQCCFKPQQPFVCDTFKNCEGLARVAFMDSDHVVMLGKIVTCERQ